MQLETIHIIIGIVTLFTTGILAYMGLKVKLDVSDAKNEIVEAQIQLSGKLDAHVQLDALKHAQIDKHLEATDTRVDKVEARRFRT